MEKRLQMKALEDLTKEQLINDLVALRRRINELEKIEEDKKKYETELNRARAMFEGLFEFAPDAVLLVNHEGRIIRVNRQGERLFGYPRSELLDTQLEILLPERFREKHMEHRRKYLAEPHVRPMGRELELYGRRKDGSEFHVDVALGPLRIEQDIFVLAVIRDFSEFKKSEASRLRELSISTATIESMPGSFYLLDEQGNLLRWNKNLEQVSGYSASEIAEMHLPDFFAGEDKRTIEQKIGEGFSEGQFTVEGGLVSKAGLKTCHFFTGLRIEINQAQCLVVIGIDITERKRIEAELRKARDELEIKVEQRTKELKVANTALRFYVNKLETSNAELENFAFVASHDLQEPLRKIRSFADRIKSLHGDSLSEKGIDYLERMQQAGARMQALILDLLKYSRITTTPEPFAVVDLRASIEEVLLDLKVLIEETNGSVEVEDLPVIQADVVQMRQLFQNLIANSLTFHDNKRPVVRVYSSTDCSAEFHEICVEDNGIGFDERYLDKIFKPFKRLHGRVYPGTGIGLAISKKIVERHGGEITARSKPGEGATFIVRLPRSEKRQ
jgi:two-component system sensor kinase FixL